MRIQFFSPLLGLVVLLASAPGHAQTVTLEPVVAVVGLPGLGPDMQGSLTLTPSRLHFQGNSQAFAIDHRNITSISIGNEQVETGGAAGKFARMVIPYGGGQALGALTHKQMALLTVEFLDRKGEYHGAVFALSPTQLEQTKAQLWVRQQLPRVVPDTPRETSSGSCAISNAEPNSVRLDPIQVDPDSTLPEEDRVLIYERLIHRLQAEKSIAEVYRAGDKSSGARCAELTITVRAGEFAKGNQAVRASVGPLGHFVGTTKLHYHLSVTARGGVPVIDKEMKKSEGSDTDSLNITKSISKAVVKELKKSEKQLGEDRVS